MRYARGHKDSSRELILNAAARRLRRDGIAAAGLTGIMAEAGLTNGGFYAHFRSKSDLVKEAIERALGEQLQNLAEGDAASGKSTQLIRSYLSPEHRDRPGTGCVSAALLPEIARESRAIRKAYTIRMRSLVEQLTGDCRRTALFTTRGMQRSEFLRFSLERFSLRAPLMTPSMSDAILAAGVRAANALAGMSEDQP